MASPSLWMSFFMLIVFADIAAGSEESEAKEFVVTLDHSNFTDFVAMQKFIVVEFYAPWCGLCKKLAPEYEKAASILSKNDPPVVLAKVDANGDQNKALSGEYDVREFPTLKILKNGGSLVQDYNGPRDADGIVTYLKKESGPALSEIKSPEEASSIVDDNKILVTLNIGYSTVSPPKYAASDPEQLKSAREDIKALLKAKFCYPILVRLGWHNAGTYNKNIGDWPKRGGANGSLRFEIELKHEANAGLVNALKLLQPIKDKYSNVTYADLFQLASATAIEEAGGPKIPMKYGRVDVSAPGQCPEEGRLPDSAPPSSASHLRDIFYRMGLNDKEIVVLSGAHTLGRSRPERSGFGKPETKYTKDGPGNPGGQSWTVQWLKFDNLYFKDIKEKKDEDLLVLPTDAVLFKDPSFKEYAEKYAADQDAFFKDYAEAHAKLSNLGAKFDPPEGFSLDDTPPKGQPEKFVAA